VCQMAVVRARRLSEALADAATAARLADRGTAGMWSGLVTVTSGAGAWPIRSVASSEPSVHGR
jgi:hypothetical protein